MNGARFNRYKKVNAARVMELRIERFIARSDVETQNPMYKRSALYGVIKLFMYASHDIEYLESRSADDRIEAI